MVPRIYEVTGKRLKRIPPMIAVDKKTKKETLIYDGKPETIPLGTWDNERVAEIYAENIRKNVTEETWTIKIKEIKL
jgi:hypothetical protein